MTLTTTLAGTDSMAGVHASLHNAENAAINTLTSGLALAAPLASPILTGTPTAPTAAPGTNTQQIATTAFAAAAIASLVNSAPTTLDTLSELATALGNDPNLATTLTALIALKAPLASPAFTGSPTFPAGSIASAAIAATLTGKTIDASANTLTGVVTLTGTQTLSGKTLTSPHLTGPVVDSGGLTVTAGNVGIGTAPVAKQGLVVQATLTGSVVQSGIYSNPTGDSGGTLEITGFYAQPATLAAAFTAGTVTGFHATSPAKGAGSTITSAYGLLVDPITSGNTNNYGIYVGAPSGASGENLGIKSLGPINITANAVPNAGGGMTMGSGAASTVGGAGAAAALPALPLGYFVWYSGSTAVKVPYYSN